MIWSESYCHEGVNGWAWLQHQVPKSILITMTHSGESHAMTTQASLNSSLWKEPRSVCPSIVVFIFEAGVA